MISPHSEESITRPGSVAEDDDDNRDDEHARENEAVIREVDDQTEAPEEFEVDDEDEAGRPKDQDDDDERDEE